jgi:hypothetical protein
VSTRDERLLELKTAVEQWHEKEVERLEAEVEFLQSIIDGRTSSGQLSGDVREFVSELVQEEVDDFLSEE